MTEPVACRRGYFWPFSWEVVGDIKMVFMFGRTIYIRVHGLSAWYFFERKIP